MLGVTMNHAPLYASVIGAVLALVPLPAHAEDVPSPESSTMGVDCTHELLYDIVGDEKMYVPANADEVGNYCGHAPTIIWSDEAISAGRQPLEYWLTPAPVVPAPEPVVVVPVVDPAPIEAVAPDPAPAPAMKHPTALLRLTKAVGRP